MSKPGSGVLASRAEHRHPEIVVLVERRQMASELAHHVGGVGVLLRLVVDGDDRDAAVDGQRDFSRLFVQAHLANLLALSGTVLPPVSRLFSLD